MVRGERVRRGALGAVLVVGGVLGPAVLAGPAVAGGAGESVRSYDAQVRLLPDGSMRVQETIVYAFAGTDKHGIYRDLATVFPYGGSQQREYPVSDVEVRSPSGAPDDLTTTDEGSRTRIRIGDAGTTVAGVQTYVIGYTVQGVLNRITTTTDDGAAGDDASSATGGPHDELFWNITGSEWEVPVERSRVSVSAPAAATAVDCFRGRRGSTERCAATAGTTSVFTTGRLSPGQGMSVVLAYPTGSVGVVAPVLRDRPQGVGGRWREVPPLGVVAVLLLTALAAAALVARSRRPGAGGRTAAAARSGPSPYVAGYEPIGVQPLTAPAGALRRTPPEGVRPAELAVLLKGRADAGDVSATVIDLAVRGFLVMEEALSRPKQPDWRLRVARPAPQDRLAPYELRLMQGLFRRRDEVYLSDLREHFSGDLRATRAQLHRDVVTRGWFVADPAAVRLRYLVGGGLAAVLPIAPLLVGLFAAPLLTLAATGVMACGVVAMVLAGRMPVRTPGGLAAAEQSEAFARHLMTVTPEGLSREVTHDVTGDDAYSRYLPYAMVLRLTGRWSRMFDDLATRGRPVRRPGWYATSHPGYSYVALGSAVGSFHSASTSVMTATRSSDGGSGFSGGGSSGGGGGGGGGGSW